MSNQFEKKLSMNFEKIDPHVREEEPPIKIWGDVTDPREHDPKEFRYLIHAFNPLATSTQPLAAASAELSGAYKVDKSEGDQSVNLFEHPERLEERVSLSMSLIDQKHIGTWGQGGIIVEVPEENIVITSPTDVGSGSASKKFLEKQSQGKQLLSGEQILKSTSDEIYNEIVAFAKSKNGETIKLKGFFIKVDKRGQPTDSVVAEKMKKHAQRLNLPIAEIEVKGHYEQEMFEITENGVWAHYDGNRYNLGSEDLKSAFDAYDDQYNTFFPSPQEINKVVEHFIERGDIKETQAQQIIEKYKIADDRRKSPKIEYEPKTQKIRGITIKDNYGKNAIEYWLRRSGNCWEIDMDEYKKVFRKMMFNPQAQSNPFERLEYQTPLSSSQVLSILKSREKTMEQGEYKKLLNFFNGIKDKIDQTHDQELSSIQKRNKNFNFSFKKF